LLNSGEFDKVGNVKVRVENLVLSSHEAFDSGEPSSVVTRNVLQPPGRLLYWSVDRFIGMWEFEDFATVRLFISIITLG
jgi:hypothetical protein